MGKLKNFCVIRVVNHLHNHLLHLLQNMWEITTQCIQYLTKPIVLKQHAGVAYYIGQCLSGRLGWGARHLLWQRRLSFPLLPRSELPLPQRIDH